LIGTLNMKKIDLIVATRNRREKLLKMLGSLPASDYLDVRIICDGDQETYDFLKDNPCYSVELTENHVGSVACRNMLCGKVNDGLLYATDDIVFENGSIEAAFDMFNKFFPDDDDGVVGFVQNRSFHPTGVALVGQKFLQRYKVKCLFFPGYFHFAAQEIYNHATRLNKFVQCQDAKVFHYHPCFMKDQHDQTHEDARLHKREDMQLKKQREAAGLIWGIN